MASRADAAAKVEVEVEGHERVFKRFDIHQRLQHLMMLTSFLTLMLTGWPLRMAGVGGSRRIVEFFGSLEACGTIHRTAAVVMIGSCIYHLVYVVMRFQQRKLRLDIVPNLRDVRDLRDNIRYFLGLRKAPPEFGRFTYFEKFDYWAVFWGIFIMAGSGLLLWFPEFWMSFLPAWMLSVAQIAHSDEALLAGLAIFIWHFYNVHLRRNVFPMNWVWLTGRISEEEMRRDHPIELERVVAERDGAVSGPEATKKAEKTAPKKTEKTAPKMAEKTAAKEPETPTKTAETPAKKTGEKEAKTAETPAKKTGEKAAEAAEKPAKKTGEKEAEADDDD